jgi:hypothetical protein
MMRPPIRKETEIELEYKIRHGQYGFINGEWHRIVRIRDSYPVEIKLYISPENDKMYKEALKTHNPLAEWWG